MPPATRRREARVAAREGILAAAHRQVSDAGAASASMAVVAARAGVAAGSLYRHFPSRGDLLAEVLRNAAAREHALVAAADPGPAAAAGERLAAVVGAWAQRAERAPHLFRALLVEPLDPPGDAVRREARRALVELLAGLVRSGIDDAGWADADPGRTATALVGALETVVGPLPAPAPAALGTLCVRAAGGP